MALGRGSLRQGGLSVTAGRLVLATVVVIVGVAATGAGTALPKSASTGCTGAMTGNINGNLTVPAGVSCILLKAHVRGNIHARRGSSLFLVGDVTVDGNISDPPNTSVQIASPSQRGPNTIRGNVSSAVVICGAVVNGNVTMLGNTFEVAVGGSEAGAACQPNGGGNKISGNLTVVHNAPTFFRVADNKVAGNVTIVDTAGAATKRVLNNSIRGNLICVHNDQPFVRSGNVASLSVGQCAP
jgi:hypothetical protein